jgi:RIO-like serine/threonine protein kinase
VNERALFGSRPIRDVDWAAGSKLTMCFILRYFNRDVECIRTFFRRRFKYESSIYPHFKRTLGESGGHDFKLDITVEASGFSRREQRVLEEVAPQLPLVFKKI